MSRVLLLFSHFIMWFLKCKLKKCQCVREWPVLSACSICIDKTVKQVVNHRKLHPECYPGTK